MLYDEARLAAADTRHAVEIAPRIWWVGEVLADDPFQCHVYLLEQGDQSVLFDPGSPLTFSGTLRKIQEVMPLGQIRYYVCHHPDPDITAALPIIDALVDRPDAVLVTHWRGKGLLRHYDLRMPFWLVDEHNWRLPLADRELQFIFTPYAHFPGAFCTFDPRSRVLFSSDIFGGFSTQPTLVARDESHFETVRLFHEHYMPSRDILGYALSQIDRFPVQAIAPQHGSIIPPRLVPFLTEKLRSLECGSYLFARGNMDLQRLSRLSETLREITQTMLLYREFDEIAKRLLELVQRDLRARRIDYYATLEDGTVLMLSPETRFAGIVDNLPLEVRTILDLTPHEWIAAHATYPEFHDHTSTMPLSAAALVPRAPTQAASSPCPFLPSATTAWPRRRSSTWRVTWTSRQRSSRSLNSSRCPCRSLSSGRSSIAPWTWSARRPTSDPYAIHSPDSSPAFTCRRSWPATAPCTTVTRVRGWPP
jgi:hypothetical protein